MHNNNGGAPRPVTGRLGTDSNFLIWILVIGALVTYFCNILVDNAALFHDEYVYKAAADQRLPEAELYAKGASEYIPNRLFVTLYRVASYSEQNFYVSAQFFNVVFWMLGLLAVCKLAQTLGVTGKRLLVFAVLAVLLPFSTYTKYFMPEAMFFCLFAITALLLFRAMFSGSGPLMLGAGLAAGLDYYVKPHALVFFGLTTLFLAVFGGGQIKRWRSIGWYAGGFILVLLIGTMVVHKPESLSRLGVYDQMVKGMMATAGTMLDQAGTQLRAAGKVALGHALLVLSIWTIALGIAVAGAATLLRRPVAAATVDPDIQRIDLFGAWVAVIMAGLVAMVIAFTVLVGEVGRIHSRYYGFVYPFMLLLLFVYDPARYRRATKVAMTVVAGVMSLALLAMPRYSPILGISLVSDSPELGFAFLTRPVATAGILLLAAAQVWAIWRGARRYWLVLAVLFAFSQYDVRQAQGHIFRGPYTDGRDAAAVEQVLGPERVRAALVVGENRDVVSKFLFNLSVVPFVGQRPFEQVGTLTSDYPNIDTFLLLTDKLNAVPGLSCEALGKRVLLCQKK